MDLPYFFVGGPRTLLAGSTKQDTKWAFVPQISPQCSEGLCAGALSDGISSNPCPPFFVKNLSWRLMHKRQQLTFL
jgi:hypothetical protein